MNLDKKEKEQEKTPSIGKSTSLLQSLLGISLPSNLLSSPNSHENCIEDFIKFKELIIEKAKKYLDQLKELEPIKELEPTEKLAIAEKLGLKEKLVPIKEFSSEEKLKLEKKLALKEKLELMKKEKLTEKLTAFTELNLKKLYKLAKSDSDSISLEVNINWHKYEFETIEKFYSTKKELTEFFLSLKKEVHTELDTQHKLIDTNYEKLLLFYRPEPLLLAKDTQINKLFLVSIRLLKEQYATLKDYLKKSTLAKQTQKRMEDNICQRLGEINNFSPTPVEKEHKPLNELKTLVSTPPTQDKEHKALVDTPSIKDVEINTLINQFNRAYVTLSEVQKKFIRALDLFPKRLSVQCNFIDDHTIYLKNKLKRILENIILLGIKKKILLGQLPERFEKLITQSEQNFETIGKALSEFYQALDEDFKKISGPDVHESYTQEKLEELEGRCQLLMELTERFPHYGQKKHLDHLEFILTKLDLRSLVFPPPNSQRMKFSSSSSSSAKTTSTASHSLATSDESTFSTLKNG